MGRENCGALEDDEDHERGLDVGVRVGDLTPQTAHPPRDAGGADQGLPGAACRRRFGLCQHFRDAWLLYPLQGRHGGGDRGHATGFHMETAEESIYGYFIAFLIDGPRSMAVWRVGA